MDIYGESIYGTQASPFSDLGWGRCTQKSKGKNTRLFLHVFDLPENDALVLPGFENRIKKAYALNGMEKLNYEESDNSIIIDLSGIEPDTNCTVITLDVRGKISTIL